MFAYARSFNFSARISLTGWRFCFISLIFAFLHNWIRICRLPSANKNITAGMTFVIWDILSFNEQERRLLFQEIAWTILLYRTEAPGKPTFVPFSTLFFPFGKPQSNDVRLWPRFLGHFPVLFLHNPDLELSQLVERGLAASKARWDRLRRLFLGASIIISANREWALWTLDQWRNSVEKIPNLRQERKILSQLIYRWTSSLEDVKFRAELSEAVFNVSFQHSN